MYKVVRTSRLYEQIVQQIEESVLNGSLKPGDQLPAERDLAQRLGVSRTAVREAVKTLREKGLVEAYSGRGTFITDGTSQAARQSFDLMVKIGQQGQGKARLISWSSASSSNRESPPWRRSVPSTTYLRYLQPSYVTFDAQFGVVKDQWTAQIFGENLGNSHASTFTSSAQWIKSEVPLRPRVIGLKVSYTY